MARFRENRITITVIIDTTEKRQELIKATTATGIVPSLFETVSTRTTTTSLYW